MRVWIDPAERSRHPTCDKRGYILRYHHVWNVAHPDDPVLPGEVIHHLDGDSLNDSIENLEKLPGQGQHWSRHAKEIAAGRARGPDGRFL
jgi:hypothetical protein